MFQLQPSSRPAFLPGVCLDGSSPALPLPGEHHHLSICLCISICICQSAPPFSPPVTNAILVFVFVFVFVSRSSLSLYLSFYRIISTIFLCHFVFIIGDHLQYMSLYHRICVCIGFPHLRHRCLNISTLLYKCICIFI